jgi:serine/threonine-protein kinase
MTSTGSPATVSVLGQLVRTRHVVVAGVIAVAGVALCAATVQVAVRLRAVALGGIVLDRAETVTRSDRPDVQIGDELVAVAGIRGSRTEALLTEVPAGATTTTTWVRGGVEHDVTLPTRPLPEIHVIALWIRVAAGIMCFLVGVVSFVLAPGTRAAWLCLAFCSNLALTLLYNVCFVADEAVFVRLMPITFANGGSLGLHLLTELPERVGLLRRRPWLAALIYLPALPIVAAALLVPVGIGLVLLGVSWSMVGGCISVPILVRGLRRARDEALRSRYRTLLVGILVGLFLPTVWHTLRQVLDFQNQKWMIHLNAAPVVLYAACVGYAVLRQNLMGADRITTTVVSYAATIMLLAVGFGALLIVLTALLPRQLTETPLALVITTAAASLSMVPLYRRLKAGVARRFQRDQADPEGLATAMHGLMQVASGGDATRALAAARATLEVLAPERVEIWLREGEVLKNGDATLPAQGALVTALAAGAGGVEGLTATALAPEAQAALWERGLALAAPILSGGTARGFVAVGRHVGGGRYRAADQAFVAMVASQLGQALERARGTATLGRYRLERRLGVGGMAEVYLAHQQGLGGFERRVAIKRPLPYAADDPGFCAMFIEEAKLAAHLHHPNIVATHGVDRVDGITYIAMEYVEGATLRTLLRASRKRGLEVPLAITAALVDALLAALAHAHDAVDGNGRKLGIVHRDVTPGNLLVGLGGEIKLADFGVARSATRLSVTQTGVIKGTLSYMAPEQSVGEAVDARADLFGAGAILYECLVGRSPYPAGPPETAPAAPPPLPDEPPALVAVVHHALAFDRAARVASADELRAAFLAAIRPLRPAGSVEVAAWVRELLVDRPDEPVVPDAQTALDRR